MSLPAFKTAESTTSVTAVLTRLSYELHALSEAADEFHHLAFSDDNPARLEDPTFVKATQSIDLMQQVLANLSDFTACLAMAAPEEMQLNPAQALSLITLSDLRARLVDAPAASIEPPVSGDADIFF